jgi:outer membrane protein assembly factor BamB
MSAARRTPCCPTPCCQTLCFLSCCLALSLLGNGMTASAGSWPSWRGPNRDGISPEKGLLDSWSDQGPPLKWKAKGLGKGYSSVSIDGGRIYTMGAAATPKKGGAGPRKIGGRGRGGRGVGSTGDCHVIALDLNTGKTIWSTAVAKGDPNCTPTIDGDRVYALGRNGELACLDTSDGKLIWTKDLTRDFGGKMMSGWGYSESPLVDGDKLLCTPGAPDAMIVALDKKTGDTIWRGAAPDDLGSNGADGAGYASIVISHGAGVKQYVQLVGRGIVSFRAEDGKFLWNYNRVANQVANIPTPLVEGDYVFASTGYQAGAALLELRKEGDGVAAKEVYFLPGNKVQNHHGGMVLVGDYVYMGNGHNNGFPLCLELKTGKVMWKGGRGAGTGSAAVLEADGELYFRYQDGVMALVEANPEKYVLKGKFNLATHNGESWPHPVIVDHCLYVRDQDALLCYDIAKR